uniref:Uncharacterized protein n=1 Tax=Saimiri boliviensis boliviensis TaxID=39432 RepID=A0A2K6U6L0_SAIBB
MLAEICPCTSQGSSNLQFIMELLYWLLEGGDSEDREDVTGNVEMKNISPSVFEISRDVFQSRCKGHGKIKVLKWFKYVLDVPVYRLQYFSN